MCVDNAAKIVLIIINVVFGLLGAVLFTLGCILRFGTPLLMPLVQPYLTQLPQIADSTGLGSLSDAGLTFDISVYTGTVGLALMLIGLGLLGICFFGCCGAYCSNTICLTVYAVIMGTLALAKLIVVIVFFVLWSTVESHLAVHMKQQITENYEGTLGTDVTSVAMNVIQLQMQCCGVTNYTDFHSATKWQRSVTLNQTIGGSSVVQNVTLQTPFSCCKISGTSIVQANNCSVTPSSDNSNYMQGCFDVLQTTFISSTRNYVAIVWFFVIAIEVALVILAILACRGLKAVSPV